MDQYLQQLLEDLRAAHKPETEFMPPALTEDEGIEAHFAEVERYLSGEYDQRIGDVLGLIPEQFPPAERLTPEQMKSVAEAFMALLFSWNITTDLPDELPIEAAYPLLVTALDKKVYLADGGMVTIEFCPYAPWDCLFGELCKCKDIEVDDMPDNKAGEDDFPF